MINLSFVRQEVEALIELLEHNSHEYIHDKTAGALAAELRPMVGWKPLEEEKAEK